MLRRRLEPLLRRVFHLYWRLVRGMTNIRETIQYDDFAADGLAAVSGQLDQIQTLALSAAIRR